MPEPMPSVGERWIASESRLGEKPTRVSSHESLSPIPSAWVRKHGIRWSVGSPVTVESRPWGMILAFFGSDAPARPDNDIEQRLLAFTELVAMGVANTESRA